MSAKTMLVKRRNEVNNGWEEVEVPVVANQPFAFNQARNPGVGAAVNSGATATTLATAGAGTYTAAHILTGLILRDPAGAGRTDTTSTAELLVALAGLGLDADYKMLSFVVVNTADADETITLAGGVGVVLQTAITIARNSATRLTIMRTSATTCVMWQG